MDGTTSPSRSQVNLFEPDPDKSDNMDNGVTKDCNKPEANVCDEILAKRRGYLSNVTRHLNELNRLLESQVDGQHVSSGAVKSNYKAFKSAYQKYGECHEHFMSICHSLESKVGLQKMVKKHSEVIASVDNLCRRVNHFLIKHEMSNVRSMSAEGNKGIDNSVLSKSVWKPASKSKSVWKPASDQTSVSASVKSITGKKPSSKTEMEIALRERELQLEYEAKMYEMELAHEKRIQDLKHQFKSSQSLKSENHPTFNRNIADRPGEDLEDDVSQIVDDDEVYTRTQRTQDWVKKSSSSSAITDHEDKSVKQMFCEMKSTVTEMQSEMQRLIQKSQSPEVSQASEVNVNVNKQTSSVLRHDAASFVPSQARYASVTSMPSHQALSAEVGSTMPRHPTLCTDATSTMPHNQASQHNTIYNHNDASLAATIASQLALPRPELIMFSGNPSEFLAFEANFMTHVGSQSIAPRFKLGYLLQYCAGPAKEAIKDCVVLPEETGYIEALKILKEQFGQFHVIAKCHLDAVLNGPPVNLADSAGLIALSRSMHSCSIALSEMKYSANLNSEETISKIASRLPKPMRIQWVEKAARIQRERKCQPTYQDLENFISERAEVANSSYAHIIHEVKPKKPQSLNTVKSTMATTSESTKNERNKCVICQNNHMLHECQDFIAASVPERLKIVQKAKLCFNCLKKGHQTAECRKDAYCKEEKCRNHKHSKFLHFKSSREQSKTPDTLGRENQGQVRESTSNVNNSAATVSQSKISLQVVRVQISSKESKPRQVYALLDQCSDVTLCTESFAKNFRSTKTMPMSIHTVSGSSQLQAKVLSLSASSIDGQFSVKLPKVLAVPSLPCSTYNIPSKQDLKHWSHLSDVSIPNIASEEICLLIGADVPSAFKVIETREGKEDDPYAVKYPLGWTIIGPIGERKQSTSYTAHFIHAEEDVLEEQMSRLWTTEFSDAPSTKCGLSVEDERALEIMENTAYLDEDNHWCIRLPWKEDPPDLPYNRQIAEKRLQNLKRKLTENPAMKEEYAVKMQSYISKGHAVKLPTDVSSTSRTPPFYLPHHAVIHPQKKKVRVVFDCSAKCNGVSLNDKLLQGPDFLNSLVGVLLRFRQEKVAIAADIEEMFNQVRVAECDRNALRFLWFEDNDFNKPVTEYQMTVHLFGATSSPSVCCYALRQSAKSHKNKCHSSTYSTCLNNFYMDDLLKSVSSSTEAVSIIEELTQTLKSNGFKLTKWISNEPDVLEMVPVSERAECVKEFMPDKTPQERTLGLIWDVRNDSFQFRVIDKNKPHTRRGILSETASFYDPCGFAAPVMLTAKFLLKELSLRKCDWDDEVPPDIKERWQFYKTSLSSIQHGSIRRCYQPEAFSIVINRQLHVFCDASEVGYGVVAYLRLQDDENKVHLAFVLGKSRLSPAKAISIPRLELSAATLAVKIALFIREELQQDIHSTTFWTDSTTVLRYIRNTKKRFKVFVANRLCTIREMSSVNQWRHVPTTQNPADIASRGLQPDNHCGLKSWISGPTFLLENAASWPVLSHLGDVSDDDKEVKPDRALCSVTVAGAKPLLIDLINQHSSWNRVKRVTAWTLRFIAKCQKISTGKNDLNVNELDKAENLLLVHVQMEAFPEEYSALKKGLSIKKSSPLRDLCPYMEDNLMKVKGRLSRAPIPESAKHPVILPSKHHVTKLLIRHCHQSNGHVGADHVLSLLREKYWIMKGKSAVRKVLRSATEGCIVCKRYSAKCQQQVMADLPTARVSPAQKPFDEVGIDYFGPLYVQFKRGTTKRYGCIFTCLSSRAVHIEICHSLDTDSFLGAFQRFIARRGRPSRVFSDNGTNLVSGQRELKENLQQWNTSKIADRLSQQGIQWNFNPPTASHFGGVWERLIRSVRTILRKMLSEQLVKDECLLTIMAEVEKILNDRPLWPSSTDPLDDPPLTPSHLLLTHSNPSLPVGLFAKEDLYARRWWKQANYLVEIFWKRWMKHYLPLLQSRKKWQIDNENLKIGDVVLVSEDTPRGQWPRGLVVKVYPDKRGIVRVVDVKMRNSTFRRPIHKLCLLEGV